MPTTDTSEKGLEALIVAALTGGTDSVPISEAVAEGPAGYGARATRRVIRETTTATTRWTWPSCWPS